MSKMSKLALRMGAVLMAGMMVSGVAMAAEYTMNKECSGNEFTFSVTKVVTEKDATKITLSPSATQRVNGKFIAPGSSGAFHLVTFDNQIDFEIVDIEGAKFNAQLNPILDGILRYGRSPDGRSIDSLSLNEHLSLGKQTSEPFGHPVILEFPAIPKTVNRFHIRATPADKSDWACLNIKLK